MAVPEQTPYKEYTANGSTTSFALGFICESKNDLIVLVDGVAPPIATWSLVGGNAVFTTAPASGKKIVLQRNTAMSRTTNYQGNNNSFRPETINKDIDRVWLKLQELGVADMLLKIYVDRLHGEQKDYIDQQDNNRNSYFENLISRQGVSLQQLDSYYNYLMQRIAQIAVDKGWEASLVADKSGRNLQEKNDDTLQIEDYIAVSATVRDAFINALTVLKSGGGGTLNLGRGKSYNIFTSTTGASTNILDFDRLKNVTINFNGSEIVTDSTVQSVPRIFHLKNPKNITFNDVRVRDLAEQAISGTSPPNHWGAQFLRITVDDTVEEADKGGIVINNIEAKHLDAVFLCDGYNGSAWSTKRFKNIAINGRVSILNCYYGAVFQNNGDNFTGVLNGENVRRLYYPSGVDGHDVVGVIKGNGLAANAGSTGVIFLKSDDVPLTNTTARFKYIGKLSHSNIVAFVIQPTTAGVDAQVMENVNVSMDFREANSDYIPDSIAAFRCYLGGSVVEQTTTNHQFKNITVDMNDPSEGSGVLKTNEFVLFGAESTKENTFQFLRSQPKMRLLKNGHILKNKALESRFFYGSLNPVTIKIPFDNEYWRTHQLFAKLSVTCINPIGSQRIYREDFYVMGNVTSAGIFQLINSSKVFTFNSGTAATITLNPNGSALDVVITGGGGFSDSNCHARIDFELIDATQRRL